MVFKNDLGSRLVSISSRLVSIIFGLMFITTPAIFLLAILREFGTTTVSCDRLAWSQINCQITQTGFLGLTINESKQLQWVKSAKQIVIRDEDSDGDTTTDYKTEIETRSGTVIFGEGLVRVNGTSGSADKSYFVANSINQFVNSRANQITVNYVSGFNVGSVFMPLIFVLPFFLVGFGCLYTGSVFETLILDRNQRQITLQHVSILGRRKKSWPLSACQKVVIKDYTDSYDNTSFTPVILLNDGQEFRLNQVNHRDQALLIANQIHRFLMLPLIPVNS